MSELTITFEEKFKESRALSITAENVEQKIVGYINGDFFSLAEKGSGGLYNDDIIVLEALFARIPEQYIVWAADKVPVLLSLTGVDVSQVNNDTWEFTLTYGIPQNGGQSGRGLGSTNLDDSNPRPDDGENGGVGWSENFTQVSFNITPTTRKRNTSLGTAACQTNVNMPGIQVPYPPNTPAPIGETEDGVEGTEVYERQFQFQVTSYFPPERLKYAYVRRLALMQTTINQGVFFGFPPGSVMFLEANASGDMYQVIPVTFGFEVRNNYKFSRTQPTKFADPSIDDPAQMYDVFYEPYFEDSGVMSGWTLVDYRYLSIADPTAKLRRQQPVLRTIHQLYGTSDFGWFGL